MSRVPSAPPPRRLPAAAIGLLIASTLSACGSTTRSLDTDDAGDRDAGASVGSRSSSEPATTGATSSKASSSTSSSSAPTSAPSTTSQATSASSDAGARDDAGKVDSGNVDSGTADTGTPDAKVTAPALVAVPLSACDFLSYQATVTLGGSQPFQMLVDTGSTTLAVASTACTNCTGVTPEYAPGPSATDTNQPVSADYGAGYSGWEGTIYSDGVSLGTEPPTPLDFAAITSQMMFFQGTTCQSAPMPGEQGILGLAPAASAAMGTQGYFDQLVATYPEVPNVFATELCPTEGTLWLGGFDPAHATASPQYTPIIAAGETAGYYSVTLTSIEVDGTTIPVASDTYPTSFVDTGTTALILLTPAFEALTSALSSNAAVKQLLGGGGDAGAGDAGANALTFFTSAAGGSLGECLTLTQSKAELDAMLPPLTLAFGTSSDVKVKAVATESYLFENDGQWCSTLESLTPGYLGPLAATVGAAVLRSSVVIFDRGNHRMGFAPHTACP